MQRYDTEYYDQKVIPTCEGRFVRHEDINPLVQALRLIALGAGGDPKTLAKGVLDDIVLR